MNTTVKDMIRILQVSANSAAVAMKTIVDNMEDDDDEIYYRHRTIADRLDEVASKMDDIDNDAEALDALLHGKPTP